MDVLTFVQNTLKNKINNNSLLLAIESLKKIRTQLSAKEYEKLQNILFDEIKRTNSSKDTDYDKSIYNFFFISLKLLHLSLGNHAQRINNFEVICGNIASVCINKKDFNSCLHITKFFFDFMQSRTATSSMVNEKSDPTLIQSECQELLLNENTLEFLHKFLWLENKPKAPIPSKKNIHALLGEFMIIRSKALLNTLDFRHYKEANTLVGLLSGLEKDLALNNDRKMDLFVLKYETLICIIETGEKNDDAAKHILVGSLNELIKNNSNQIELISDAISRLIYRFKNRNEYSKKIGPYRIVTFIIIQFFQEKEDIDCRDLNIFCVNEFLDIMISERKFSFSQNPKLFSSLKQLFSYFEKINTSSSIMIHDKLIKYMIFDNSENIRKFKDSISLMSLSKLWKESPKMDNYLLLVGLNLCLQKTIEELSENRETKISFSEIFNILSILKINTGNNFILTSPIVNLIKDQTNLAVFMKIFNKILDIRNRFFVNKVNRKSVYSFVELTLNNQNSPDDCPLPAQFSNIEQFESMVDLIKVHNFLIQVLPRQEVGLNSEYIFHNNFLMILWQIVKLVKGVGVQGFFLSLTQNYFQSIDNMERMKGISDDLKNQICFLIMAACFFLKNNHLRHSGLTLINCFMKTVHTNEEFCQTIADYKSLSNTLNNISRTLAQLNKASLASLNFNYSLYYKIIAEYSTRLSAFINENNENKLLFRALIGSFYRLHHSIRFSSYDDNTNSRVSLISNTALNDWEEAFVSAVCGTNPAILKLILSETIQSYMKKIFEENTLEKSSDSLHNYLMHVNFLIMQRINISRSFLKKIECLLHFIEICELIVSETRKVKLPEKKLLDLIKTLYLRNFEHLLLDGYGSGMTNQKSKESPNLQAFYEKKDLDTLLLSTLERVNIILQNNLKNLNKDATDMKVVSKYISISLNVKNKIIVTLLDKSFGQLAEQADIDNDSQLPSSIFETMDEKHPPSIFEGTAHKKSRNEGNPKTEECLLDRDQIYFGFQQYQACVKIIKEIEAMCIVIMLQNESDNCLDFETFTKNFLSSSSTFFSMFAKAFERLKTFKFKVLFRNLVNSAQLCNYFGCSAVSLRLIQIGISFILIVKQVTKENERQNEEAQANLHFLFKMELFFHWMGSFYKKLGMEKSSKQSYNYFCENHNFEESRNFLKHIPHENGVKKENDSKSILKNLNFYLEKERLLLENSHKEESNIENWISGLNDIVASIEKRKFIWNLIIFSKYILYISESLRMKGLSAAAQTLLSEELLPKLVGSIMKLEKTEIIKNILGKSSPAYRKKILVDRFNEMKENVYDISKLGKKLSETNRLFLAFNVLETGIFFNGWSLHEYLSKAVKKIIDISLAVGMHSYVKYYSGLFNRFEMRCSRLPKYLQLKVSSKRLQDFADIDCVLELLVGQRPGANLLRDIFLNRRRSAIINTSYSQILEKITAILKQSQGTHPFLKTDFLKHSQLFILNLSHKIARGYPELELHLISNIIKKDCFNIGSSSLQNDYSLKKDFLEPHIKCRVLLNLLTLEDSPSSCKDEPLSWSPSRSSFRAISRDFIDTKHRISLKRSMLRENFLMLRVMNSLIIEDRKPELVELITYRDLAFYFARSILKYDRNLSYHFYHIFLKYQECIMERAVDLEPEEFLKSLDEYMELTPERCNCSSEENHKKKTPGKENIFDGINIVNGLNEGKRSKRVFFEEEASRAEPSSVFFSEKKEIELIGLYFDNLFEFKQFKREVSEKKKKFLQNVDVAIASEESKIFRRSFMHMRIANNDQPLVKFIKDNLKLENSRLKEFKADEGIKRNLGERDIVALKLIKNYDKKILIISRFSADFKNRTVFKIKNQKSLNLLMDYLNDLKKCIGSQEKELHEYSKKEKTLINPVNYWESRNNFDKMMENNLKNIETVFDYLVYVCMGDIKSEEEFPNKLIMDDVNSLINQLVNVIDEKRGVRIRKVFKNDIKRLKELLYRLMLSSYFEQFSDVKMKLIIEDISMHNLFFSLFYEEAYPIIVQIIQLKNSKYVKQSNRLYQRKPVLLLLDENFQAIPFEYCPSFLTNKQCFYRIPSLSYLKSLPPNKSRVYSMKDLFYVVNPGQDLPMTQISFEKKFSNMKKWSGTMGQIPEKHLLANALTEKDFYIYLGHGAGENYFSEKDIVNIKNINSIILLFGCSSSKQIKNNENNPLESEEIKGISLEYLLSNCPLLMGSLWDITDKDTDSLTERMLKYVLSKENLVELPEALMAARSACRLKYLNGSAFVFYGIPLEVSK